MPYLYGTHYTLFLGLIQIFIFALLVHSSAKNPVGIVFSRLPVVVYAIRLPLLSQDQNYTDRMQCMLAGILMQL